MVEHLAKRSLGWYDHLLFHTSLISCPVILQVGGPALPERMSRSELRCDSFLPCFFTDQ